MKFHTAALQFLVASEALRFGVRAFDRTSDTIVADAAVSDVSLGINNLRVVVDPVTRSKTGTMHHTVADAGVSDILLETPVDSGGRFSATGINNLRVDSVTRGDGSSSKTGSMHHTIADAGVSDVLLETPADSGGRFSGDGSSSKTSTTYHTVADAGVSNVLLETPVDSGGRFSGDGSSFKTGTMYHTAVDAGVSDVLLETPVDSGGRFFPTGISNLRVVVDPVTRSKTGTTHHTVADAGESDVLLETLPVDSGGRFFPSDINNNLYYTVVDSVTRGDGSSSKTGTMHHTFADAGVSVVLLETDSGGSLVPPSGIINHHAVLDAINDDNEISPFTSSDGDTVSTQRKLSKTSKKVKHPDSLCTLSLFADSLFLYANKCYTDIMVTISPCDDKDDMCYISEHLPSVPQEEQENQEEEQCFVGGSFPAKQNIRYNPSTGDCEFLYVDLTDDPCNSYTGDTGTGSLGLKARINVKNNPDMMFIQFTNNKGLTFYNYDDERVAKKRSPTQDNRYLRQEGATKPVLSMMPHPFASRRLYYKVAIKNDTPYEAISARIEYCGCADDENNFIASGGTWTADTYRGGCLVKEIHSALIIDGREERCSVYSSSGTGISEFFLMWIDGGCCVRSSEQSNTECPELDIDYCDPSTTSYYTCCTKTNIDESYCQDYDCAHPMWADGCEACMCFNNGNAAWCDGTREKDAYYDTYFEEHGKNPWGDTNVKNRKCNSGDQYDYSYIGDSGHGQWNGGGGFRDFNRECVANWQCKKPYLCHLVFTKKMCKKLSR